MSSRHPSFWRLWLSVLAAMFGVQSEKNRLRDFNSGAAWPYMLLGLLSVVLFAMLVIAMVRWALYLAGA
ncbi:DUF2970 domain-containing protein [Marinobacterium arenosum]|uniref:DUF2970 domain-containing protein n=1 Tax=Marinobacterium arenosum TaxID=2862496 RepID=UPI001C987E14|nr:DUF2970 domain-containing protein [Marinobacterium arenosum]MBY4675503.1 DUF2970 domain-containing protein [Marinobacterium arenosum]